MEVLFTPIISPCLTRLDETPVYGILTAEFRLSFYRQAYTRFPPDTGKCLTGQQYVPGKIYLSDNR